MVISKMQIIAKLLNTYVSALFEENLKSNHNGLWEFT